MNDFRRSENPTKPTTSDMTVEQILNDFRQSSIIIHSNNSLGGGEGGRDAFERSLSEALAAIEAHYAAIRKADMKYVKYQHAMYGRDFDEVVAERLNNTEEI